jgi:hypothetical protein
MIGQRLRKLTLTAFAALSLLSTIGAALAQPAPVPALPDTERRTSYSITASTCACNVNFALYGDSTDFQDWLEVFLNGVRVNFNDPTFGWTITSPSGTIGNLPLPITNAVLTFTNPQTGVVQIVGARRPRRISQFNENQGVPARNLNVALTDLVAQNREVWDKINDVTGRGLFFAPGNTTGPMPTPAACASAFLAFDGTGLNPVCVSFASGGGNVVGTSPSVVNDIPIWLNATGTELADSGISLGSQAPHLFLATPSGGAGNPLMRAIVASDLPVTPPVGGWHIANLTAANDASFPTDQMDLNADWVTFYNPSTGALITKGPLIAGGQIVSGLGCDINGSGPVAGGRDQSAAFVSENTVWWYLILNTSGTISCETSLTGPTALNSGGTTGPVLPSGYIAYAPAFPLPLIGSATLEPAPPQGGALTFKVVGNTVLYPNTPFIACDGFPSGNCGIAPWMPSIATSVTLYVDIELTCAASCIAGAVFSTSLGNFYNASMYPTIADVPFANNAYIGPVVIPSNGIFQFTYSHSSGTPANDALNVGPAAYTFSNGN